MPTALERTRTPRRARYAARWLLVALPLLALGLALLPWTQSAHGTGRAIAFNPVQRPQAVMATLEGRIFKWHVVEGQKVKAGERLVELLDNDPDLLRRMEEEENTVEAQELAVRGTIAAFEAQVTNQRFAQIQALQVERQQIIIAQNEVERATAAGLAAKATLVQNELDFPRVESLFKKGLEQERNFEIAKRNLEIARNGAEIARIAVANARESFTRSQRAQDVVKAQQDALIDSLTANVKRATGDIEGVKRSRLAIQSRIERQRRQFIDAPTAGTIFRLLANGEAGGQLVRAGDRLATLVPDVTSAERFDDRKAAAGAALGGTLTLAGLDAFALGRYPGIVAEVTIDGNDLPLIRVGDQVRLQFEGWPAVQFVGWPSTAVGTFGGRVYLVDPTAAEDRGGKFRILVEPDGERPWPGEEFLRQGVRVQGWVLFNDVPVWWELFRQLNGFPPTRPESEKSAGGPFGPVEAKVKVKK